MFSKNHVLDSLSLGKIVQIRERLLRTQAAGKKVYRFESGDPDFSLSPSVLNALKNAADQGKTHYIPNAGIPELRRALFRKLTEKNKIPVKSPDDVYVTNGAMHALFSVFTSLLDDGDEVIVPDPMWTEVVENIKLARGVPVPVALKSEQNYEYLPHEILKKITDKTKVIFINTPHNPTGAVTSKEHLIEIARIAKERNLWIVSDEAYEDIVYAPYEHHSIAALAPEDHERIISIFSFSKSHAMSGLRVGYFTASGSLFGERIQKILRCSINGVNSIAQWAALNAVETSLSDPSYMDFMRQQYAIRRDVMFQSLSQISGFKPFYPRGTFFLWVDLDSDIYKRMKIKNADDLANHLAEMGIGSTPGDAFGQACWDSMRFSFSCSTEMVVQGSNFLHEVLLNLQNNF